MSMPRRLSIRPSTSTMQIQHWRACYRVWGSCYHIGTLVLRFCCYKVYNEFVLLNILYIPGTTVLKTFHFKIGKLNQFKQYALIVCISYGCYNVISGCCYHLYLTHFTIFHWKKNLGISNGIHLQLDHPYKKTQQTILPTIFILIKLNLWHWQKRLLWHLNLLQICPLETIQLSQVIFQIRPIS